MQKQQSRDPLNVICARLACSHFVVRSPTWRRTQTPYSSIYQMFYLSDKFVDQTRQRDCSRLAN
jgi:hypothetical protein